MKIVAINGGPRANHNTGTLLKEAVNGARSKGAEVEVVNLYKLNYKGCTACMSCKRKSSDNTHKCVVKDDLTEVLQKVKNCDVIIFASPIYFSDITGQMRSFLERLLYPYLSYDYSVKEGTYFPRILKTGFIYTMGQAEGAYEERLKAMEGFISLIFRIPTKQFYSYSNYPFLDNFRNYESSDLTFLLKIREEQFTDECKRAFEFGEELVKSN